MRSGSGVYNPSKNGEKWGIGVKSLQAVEKVTKEKDGGSNLYS